MLRDISIKGFSTTQAEKLLEQYGLNAIEEQEKPNFFRLFLSQFNNFLTFLLIGAAILSLFVGARVDAIFILAIVVLNALFGIYQEKKASDAIAALKDIAISRVRVLRDGHEVELDSRYLVPGDIIFVEEGVKVPADSKVVESINLQTNEAALTGESIPVGKKVSEEVYMGTIVARGRGYAEVVQTGMRTKFGQIAARLESIEDSETPLQIKLENLSKFIGLLGILVSLGVFFISFFEGIGYFPAFLLAISLAVAVVPEGLPSVMTITLAIGVKEMASQRAVVRRLSAIEALGNVTVIATDKTGVLTANKMKVKEIFIDGKEYGENSLPSHLDPAFSRMILNGITCSTASLLYDQNHGTFNVLGDPTEGALLFLAQKAGVMPDVIREKWQLIDENPFESTTKMMTVVVKKDQEILTLSKGAAESIIPNCDTVIENGRKRSFTSERIKKIQEAEEEWAKKGLRILAFSYKEGFHKPKDRFKKHTFLGMVAINDPPRIEVKDAIKRVMRAGIRVVMITGDNEKTAEAIGLATGLIEEGEKVISGKQIDTYSDEDLKKLLPNIKIFARTTPFHKSRIVKLFQETGEVVAVTGDGVNDAIALKQADVGIAMGQVGTDVARETSDVVIMDDNFATIVKAIEEGRNIIRNLKNAIKYLLACNISEALALLIGLAMDVPNLFFAIQLLYINLITDGIPALALAFSPREEKTMERPPEKSLSLLNAFDKYYIVAIGLGHTLIVLTSYFIFQMVGQEEAKTAAFSTLALVQSFIFVDVWLSHRSLRSNLFGLFLSPQFLVAFSIPFITQYAIVTFPYLASVFKTKPTPWTYFLIYVALSAFMLIWIKGVKLFLPERIAHKSS